jgi:hypothetical protein
MQKRSRMRRMMLADGPMPGLPTGKEAHALPHAPGLQDLSQSELEVDGGTIRQPDAEYIG